MLRIHIFGDLSQKLFFFVIGKLKNVYLDKKNDLTELIFLYFLTFNPMKD
jgi:hypothetical protein